MGPRPVSHVRQLPGGSGKGAVPVGGCSLRPPSPRELLRHLPDLLAVYRGGTLPRMPREGPGGTGVAVVLGTQVLPGGRPSRTLEARVRRAARLYAEGEAGVLIPTGGIGEYPPSEAEVMAHILREEGVPESAVLLEEDRKSTRLNSSHA